MHNYDPQHPAFAQIDHRPWPLPQKKHLLDQTWLDLAFIHWEVAYDQMRARIPEPLEIDTFDGKAWIGIVPFDMQGVTFRGLSAISALSNFPEINVRTYVTFGGKPGVWFFSLDVPSSLAVWAARRFFHLPYRRAQVHIHHRGDDSVDYRHTLPGAEFAANYRPLAKADADQDAFAHWATERYCLYCRSNKGRIYRTEVQHPQWQLDVADITIHRNTLLDPFEVGECHPSVLYAKQIQVVAYAPERVV